jgi:methionyl-tRNA formyltransferase
MSTRIVFMGSPVFAVPILEALFHAYQVTGVVTQPDRPSGRGKILTSPPVKNLAVKFGLEILQPVKLKDPDVFEKLVSWKPEVIVLAAFGQILRQNVLDLPPFGCINVHASLLPRWRGAAPIQAAIMAGDQVSGVSIMQMDPGIDTGGVFSKAEVYIEAKDTSETLTAKLAQTGASLLIETLPGIITGDIKPMPQDETRATYAPKIEKSEGVLDFSQDAIMLERKVRAFYPWPGSSYQIDGEPLKILGSRIHIPGILPVGQRGIIEGFPAIGTRNGDLVLTEVQPAGKNRMAGNDFLRGYRQWVSG